LFDGIIPNDDVSERDETRSKTARRIVADTASSVEKTSQCLGDGIVDIVNTDKEAFISSLPSNVAGRNNELDALSVYDNTDPEMQLNEVWRENRIHKDTFVVEQAPSDDASPALSLDRHLLEDDLSLGVPITDTSFKYGIPALLLSSVDSGPSTPTRVSDERASYTPTQIHDTDSNEPCNTPTLLSSVMYQLTFSFSEYEGNIPKDKDGSVSLSEVLPDTKETPVCLPLDSTVGLGMCVLGLFITLTNTTLTNTTLTNTTLTNTDTV
jgi:hypothetical protein